MLKHKYPKDLTGLRFTRLTVLGYCEKRKKLHYWNCLCDCGNKSTVSRNCLISNNTKSCGCYNSDNISARNKKDLTGNKYNKLFVESFNCIKNNRQFWNCICECGNKSVVSSNHLIRKQSNTKSCGCWRKEMPTLRVKEKHPSWNPEISDKQKSIKRATLEDRKWSSLIKIRDSYTCRISGQKGGELCSHHIYNWADNPEKRFDLDNGITISRRLHIIFHSLFKKKNNTLFQLLKFKILYKSGSLDKILEIRRELESLDKQIKNKTKQINAIIN